MPDVGPVTVKAVWANEPPARMRVSKPPAPPSTSPGSEPPGSKTKVSSLSAAPSTDSTPVKSTMPPTVPLPGPVNDQVTSSGGPRMASAPPWPAKRIGISRFAGSEVISRKSVPLPPWIVRPQTVEIERDSVTPLSVSPMRPSAKVSSSRLSMSLSRTSHASGAGGSLRGEPTAASPPSAARASRPSRGPRARRSRRVRRRGRALHQAVRRSIRPEWTGEPSTYHPQPAASESMVTTPAVALRESRPGEVRDRERDPVRAGPRRRRRLPLEDQSSRRLPGDRGARVAASSCTATPAEIGAPSAFKAGCSRPAKRMTTPSTVTVPEPSPVGRRLRARVRSPRRRAGRSHRPRRRRPR